MIPSSRSVRQNRALSSNNRLGQTLLPELTHKLSLTLLRTNTHSFLCLCYFRGFLHVFFLPPISVTSGDFILQVFSYKVFSTELFNGGCDFLSGHRCILFFTSIMKILTSMKSDFFLTLFVIFSGHTLSHLVFACTCSGRSARVQTSARSVGPYNRLPAWLGRRRLFSESPHTAPLSAAKTSSEM